MKGILRFFGVVRYFDREDGGGATVEVPPKPAELVETSRQTRDRLREEIRARGEDPTMIESIWGDCDQQVAIQVEDYTTWLAAR